MLWNSNFIKFILYFRWTSASDKTLHFPFFRKLCQLVVLRKKLNRWRSSSIRFRGLVVHIVNFTNIKIGRGLSVKQQFESQEFLVSYWRPRRATQVANFDCVREVQNEKDSVFIDTSDETNSGLAMFINDKKKLFAAKCRKEKILDDKVRPQCISWQLLGCSVRSV